MAVLDALRISMHSFQDHLVVESNSLNVISRISSSATSPWGFNVILMKSNTCHLEFRWSSSMLGGWLIILPIL